MPAVVSVVVHPSRVYREGLTRILAQSPFEPACAASSTKDVPPSISDGGEQVLVLIGVRESSNLAAALSATKASFPDAYVVVIGDASKRDNVTTALAFGATSFVDENLATSTLVKELELVALGEPVISVLILKQLLGHCSAPTCGETAATPTAADEPSQLQRREPPPPEPREPPPPESPEPPPLEAREQGKPGLQLSGREAAILNGLVQGASNKLIAYQLKITEATVKVHVKAILRKIRVKNRTQAAIWALNCQTAPTKGSEDGEPRPAAPMCASPPRPQ